MVSKKNGYTNKNNKSPIKEEKKSPNTKGSKTNSPRKKETDSPIKEGSKTNSPTKKEVESDIKLALKKTNSEEKPKDKAKDKITNDITNENTKNENLEFQICDWNSYHEIDGNDEEKYVIQLFGRTEDDKDVCLKVTGFTPFFYVEVPTSWTTKQADKFVDILKNKVSYCANNNPNYEYDLSQSLVRHALVQKYKFYNFTNKKLFKFVMLVFKNHTAMREYANILAKPLKATGLTKEPMLYQRYESNIEPHIRFMHINNLSSCGWVSIDKTKLKTNKEYSNCDHSYHVNWKEVKPSDNDDRMAPFKIMGYDIECTSCDHNFPQAERKTDKIIQIGITMYRYGSMNCYEQHILTLKECAAIKGATVECYKTEKGLIRGWAKKVRDIRPDFKAGYNNFGFDDKYIFDRIARIDQEEADKQGVSVEELENKFMDEILMIMGKVNNKYLMEMEGLKKSLTYFEVKNLSSSALGDNELKFIQVPGILSVDMMKIIQRDHRLVGYKLDNVSANFITEGATKFVEEDKVIDGKVKIKIYTKSTKALEKDSYIQIMVNDGYSSTPLSEGAKYKVFDIETITEKKFNEKEKKEETFVYQCIKTEIGEKDVMDLREIILNPLLKVYWTFAKDDMHHTLINKYFKEGDPKRIRQIAKYCLKDCKLVNLLLAKLEIIVNSVGMAKVCHVPLSYLFLRGQGVKIFSLVSKKCREKNFLIPVLRRKKKDASGDEDETYEGATVITPKPDVYLSPIGVLDYSSLYPNSMRERNLSQECYVNDPKYDNLPGYVYHDVYIVLKDKKGKILRNIDGTPQKEHHRFAQELITEEQMNEELKDIIAKINADTEKNIEKIKQQKYFTESNRKEKIEKENAKLERNIKEINNNKELSEKEKTKAINKEKEKFNENVKHLFDLNDKINLNKALSEKRIKDIIANEKFTEEIEKKLIKEEQELFDENNKFLIEMMEIVVKQKEEFDKQIKIISDNKNLSDNDKSKKINEIKDKFIKDITTESKNIKLKSDEIEKLKVTLNAICGRIEVNADERNQFIEWEKEKAKKKIADEKAKKYNIVNGQTVRYGILPEILTELLNKRKETNGRLAQEKDSFKKAILNALQLAFKVTANSLYGQTGAPTSPIYFIAIAASTTAIGRERLHYAKKMVEENFPGSEVIYGDTDSIFINFHIKDEDGNDRTDKKALIKTIELAQQAAKLINDNVPKPQGIVYEKTLHPFILVAKKKYVGLLFEKDPNKYSLKSMGIVLKRRDNAPIVKIVVGGIIDHLLKNRDIDKAVEYTQQVIRKLMDGKYPIDKFIISKTLKATYKKPSTIAHKVLADRMAERDPGNKPQINDRIPFVYIVKDMGKKKKKDILQGDLIEHPEFVIKNGLKIDYLYYLEHQIINPATQILELMMPTKKVDKMFKEFIIEEENKRKRRQSIEKWVDTSKIKTVGSKTAKVPSTKSVNKRSSTNDHDNNHEDLPFCGKGKKFENQNMEKWMDYATIKEEQSKESSNKLANAAINNNNKDNNSKSKKKSTQTMDRWIGDASNRTTNSDEWEPDF
ncbi:B-family DNA polymerase [Tupanvirus deep ocean]|uniref:B-family DNA polymerase n=2 Tax=Tupanvirus TaxID=2094720 RepID=A0AC62A881_9VIRU|nr:B-family DNA polymerase [Tupanvirus deep ocean]QKU33833.1 B-family DNA polymerase [Tupanvirus deep ocean]